MTKDELSQLMALKKEIQDLQRRKSEIEARAEATTQHLDGMPRGNRLSDPVGRYGGDAAWVAIRIERLLEQYRDEFRRLWDWIESIEDSQIRLIFRLYYVDGYTWQRIANHMGEQDRSYPWRLAERYIANLQQM